MKFYIALIFLACILQCIYSYPYPVEVYEEPEDRVVEFVPIRRRMPRRVIVEEDEDEPMTSATHSHGHGNYGGGGGGQYVDYGAYTGGYGAFGWYTDHPVHTYY